jgi:uncharacterized SAM-dependent methyltransferase
MAKTGPKTKNNNSSANNQINDMIFKELLKRGYSLEGKTRIWDISDSKLWYITQEQAQAYLNLVASEDYTKEIGPKEIMLIKTHISEILNVVLENNKEAINIIDLGCGNGKKAIKFIETLKDKNIKIRYCPIDISGHMVQTALDNISKLNVEEIVNFQWNISDFENLENISPLLRNKEYKKHLFLLLGNTFGNFETHELLYQVRNGMKDDDFLLIGNGLNNQKVEEDIVKACRENPGFDKFFIYLPLRLGLKKEDVEFDVRFKNSRIEFFYTLKKDKNIKFQNKKVNFNKGDQIITAIAYHYEQEEFMSFLKMYFSYVRLFTSEDGSYTLALCRK